MLKISRHNLKITLIVIILYKISSKLSKRMKKWDRKCTKFRAILHTRRSSFWSSIKKNTTQKPNMTIIGPQHKIKFSNLQKMSRTKKWSSQNSGMKSSATKMATSGFHMYLDSVLPNQTLINWRSSLKVWRRLSRKRSSARIQSSKSNKRRLNGRLMKLTRQPWMRPSRGWEWSSSRTNCSKLLSASNNCREV